MVDALKTNGIRYSYGTKNKFFAFLNLIIYSLLYLL